MNGAELFAACLQAQRVEWVSALCGNGLNDILAACKNSDIRVIDTRNEQAAAYMAASWGRLSGRPGVCLVSSGVAHVNALAGVVDAHFDGAPMLLTTGAGPLQTAGMGHFQDLDQVALAAPVCKYARQVGVAEQIPALVHAAFAAAMSGRPGPVHLTLPMDIQAASAEGVPPCRLTTRPLAGHPASRSIERAVALLKSARRPLLVAGSGVYYAGAAQALADFAGAYAIPVTVPIWDRGVVPHRQAEYLGVIGAATGGPSYLAAADLVILAGAEVDYRVGYLQSPPLRPETQVIRLQAGQTNSSQWPVDLEIDADLGAALSALHDACLAGQVRGFEDWLAEAQRQKTAFQHRLITGARRTEEQLHALDILEALAKVLTPETILVVDGGNIGQWFHQTLGHEWYPGHWLTCGASGAVGFGIAGAMAARAGFPQRPVLLLSGDGSATFAIAELERAVAQNLPFVSVVADDQCWGIVESGQLKRYGKSLNSRLGPIDFAALARSLGALGTQIRDKAELHHVLRQALVERQPTLIHVPICGGTPGSD